MYLLYSILVNSLKFKTIAFSSRPAEMCLLLSCSYPDHVVNIAGGTGIFWPSLAEECPAFTLAFLGLSKVSLATHPLQSLHSAFSQHTKPVDSSGPRQLHHQPML